MPSATMRKNGAPEPRSPSAFGSPKPFGKRPLRQANGRSRSAGTPNRNRPMAEGGRSCVTAWRVATAQTAQIVTVAKTASQPMRAGRVGPGEE